MIHRFDFGIAGSAVACTLLVAAFMGRQIAVSRAQSHPLARTAANVAGSCYTVVPIPLARPDEAQAIPIPLARPGEAQVIPVPPACVSLSRRPPSSVGPTGGTSAPILGLRYPSAHGGIAALAVIEPGHLR